MDQWTDRLSEFVDGDLGAAERAACEAHLRSCAACRAVVDDLAAMKAEARALADEAPDGDLWPGVLARLAPAPAAGRGAEIVPLTTRRWTFTFTELALAATLLIGVSAGVTWLVAGRDARDAGAPPVVAVAEPRADSGDVRPATFADADYDAAVTDLEQVLRDQRDLLDPQTVRIIERNLAAIDDAIRQARQALDADPGNPYLNSYLVDSRRRKLDLLRRATRITSMTEGD